MPSCQGLPPHTVAAAGPAPTPAATTAADPGLLGCLGLLWGWCQGKAVLGLMAGAWQQQQGRTALAAHLGVTSVVVAAMAEEEDEAGSATAAFPLSPHSWCLLQEQLLPLRYSHCTQLPCSTSLCGCYCCSGGQLLMGDEAGLPPPRPCCEPEHCLSCSHLHFAPSPQQAEVPVMARNSCNSG